MAFKQGAPYKCLDALKFTCYSADEIRKLSVKHITNPTSLDSLLNPTENGLYDPVLGPPTRLDTCATCGLGSATCPGHMGHIELPLPVYHPAFFKVLFYLLRGSCLKCHRILIHQPKMLLLLYKLRAINRGLFQLVNKLQETYSEVVSEQSLETNNNSRVEIIDSELKRAFCAWLDRGVKKPGGLLRDVNELNVFSKNATELKKSLTKEFVKLMTLKLSRCQYCAAGRPALRSELNSKIFLVETTDKTRETTQHYLTPIVIRDHISKLWENDQAILENVFGAFHDTAFGDKSLDASPDGNNNSPNKRSAAMDVLFVSVLPVPPSRYRPVMVVNERQYENPQTSIYSKIILDSILLRTLMTNLNEDEVMDETASKDVDATGKTTMWKKDSNDIQISDKSIDMLSAISGKTKGEKLEKCWERLQQHVNVIYDSDLSRSITGSTDNCPGIKQKLEKKGGLFRKHMMGKRVNYAARSVISPDPYIATHEIGVPLCFASKLTYPTPVTPWNVKKLRKAVINGPNVYPGATMVIQEDGNVTLLKADNENQRIALAKNLNAPQKDRKKRKQGLKGIKTVLRHMQNGDVMLLNRQPTLHKGSIMAHKVRVLPGEKTLRLHYANCKSYNADFDGDEMNAHFPQSELCRAEAFELMSTNTQYLSMKDGKPLSGLIQDHMVAGVSISMRGRCFTREQYQQLSYNALMHIPRRIKLLPPAFLRPKMLWTGKQIFSTILINITPAGSPPLNLCGSSKIKDKDWIKHRSRPSNIGAKEMCESEVIIRGSELLCGVLDKNHYGPAEYGLVHSMYEMYGCVTSGLLLTCLARLFTAFLQQYRGLTLGVHDILVTESADVGRSEVIKQTLNSGLKDIAAAVGLKDVTNTDEIKSRMQDAHLSKITGGEDGLAAIDHAMKKASNDITEQIGKLCTGSGLTKTFPENNLQLIVISGAKGGAVNCMQISCLLGQIELEGRRPPLMPSGRSVPSFLPYDLTLRAGGFISQRFLTGIRPQEYFYHCMAGREGLVDTAVKTSRSGYLQRCLIKHLEGLVLSYDLTVRDSDGSILQFLYGEDGIDIGLEPFLNPKQYKFLSENFEAQCNLLPNMEQIESTIIDTTKADKLWRKMNRRLKRKRKAEKKMMRERKTEILDRRKSPFLEFTWENKQLTKSQAIKAWRSLVPEKKNEYVEKMDIFKMPDPISASLRPDMYLGSMSEQFKEKLDDYMESNPDKLPLQVKKKKAKIPSLERVKSMLNLKYQRALCPPGESVGLLAAQSIGEPSTQMTLNTFHFAGRGDMNVTLGIPRLREILMVAAKQIGTPQVFVPVWPGKEKEAKKLQKQFTCVKLSQVLHKVNIEENLDVDSGTMGHRSRRCKIKIEILPEKQFKRDLALSRKQVLNYIEKHFLRSLLSAINQQLRKRQEEEMVFSQKMARATKDQDENNIDEKLEEAEPSNDVADDKGEEDEEGFEEDDAKHGKNKEDSEDDEPDDNADDLQEIVMQNDESCDIEENSNVSIQDFQANKSEVSDEKRARISKITTLSVGFVSVLEYNFDEKEDGWCKMVIDMPLKSAQVNIVSLLEQEANNSFVRRVKKITRCVLQNGQNGELNLATEGINFFKLFEHADTLDLNRLKCNCVHSMETTYGIEAAVRVIEREVTNVFAVYGIEVSKRHLSIVADYMCFLGKYNAFNRIGIENCASPLQQMTFETTVKFLNDAALSGQWDSLQSPSARIVAGQVVKGGTGKFTLKIPLSKKAYKQCGLT